MFISMNKQLDYCRSELASLPQLGIKLSVFRSLAQAGLLGYKSQRRLPRRRRQK